MKILIVEDEPIIAIDLEDIVLSQVGAAEVLVVDSLDAALSSLAGGIDFALLDIALGSAGETSLPIAQRLLRDRVPFCFVSSSLDNLPATFNAVPKVSKPFRPEQVAELLPVAA
ncbi:response regulator [Aurantimonas endophytica]|uniref:DNA-binding LytR/AlgR family response regulator n=1 Tax=Aurantimonas endophytica TaxID=1522175 RepID=A0A7W6MMS5_9HYPH|nr:response regulator [Aurantimonas endophytica]MBB4001160.1 DNA-binding LytR/AlgR family response regulator [Aurantimonas endophytica]MCO6403186.1 response regulator [Aurantimonas endophytica]